MPLNTRAITSAVRIEHDMNVEGRLPIAGYIKNRETLLTTGEVKLRRMALDIADAAIAGADPGLAVHRHMSLDGELLRVGEAAYNLTEGQRVFVIGAGKATYPVARAVDDILGARIYKGFVTCKYGQEGRLSNIEMHFARHPVPDEASLEAARRTVELLAEVRAGDIVIACFTGGSSALFVSPVEDVSLEDKAATNHVLLTCGANIIEINAVRKHLSTVKGGRLARMLPPGVNLINLTVSDVIGDYLDYITDPTVVDTSSFRDAQATLDRYGLWERSAGISDVLSAARA